ncbi:MAG: hypothetical protein ACOYVD_06175 [Bacillota bacterium]
MDFENILAMKLVEAKIVLEAEGYAIDKVNFLNQPPGTARIVRVKKTKLNSIELLVTWHEDTLQS